MDPDEPAPAEPVPPEAAEPAPPARTRLKSRPDVRVRVGPICLPSAALAWGLSIAAHGALLGIGIVALRSARDVPSGIALARGDGGEDGGGHGSFFVDPGAGSGAGLSTARMPAPPAMSELEAAPQAIPEPGTDEHAEDWAARPVPPLPAGEIEVSEAAIVGLPPIAPAGGEPYPSRGGQADAAGAGAGATTGAGFSNSQRGDSDASDAHDGSAGSSGGASDGVPGSPGIPGGVADASLPAPVYPRESRLRGEEGTVVVEVMVGADGVASDFHVVDDAGFPRLADAALAAVRKARFRPAIENGRPAACSVKIPFRFRLRNRR